MSDLHFHDDEIKKFLISRAEFLMLYMVHKWPPPPLSPQLEGAPCLLWNLILKNIKACVQAHPKQTKSDIHFDITNLIQLIQSSYLDSGLYGLFAKKG